MDNDWLNREEENSGNGNVFYKNKTLIKQIIRVLFL